MAEQPTKTFTYSYEFSGLYAKDIVVKLTGIKVTDRKYENKKDNNFLFKKNHDKRFIKSRS